MENVGARDATVVFSRAGFTRLCRIAWRVEPALHLTASLPCCLVAFCLLPLASCLSSD